MEKTSSLPGFYKLSLREKLEVVKNFAGLTDGEVEALQRVGALGFETAGRMIENVVGVMQIPLGVAVNFLVNGQDYLIPMAIEEPSVVAAASNAAKMARVKGGFKAESTDPVMIGQIQILDVPNPEHGKAAILAEKEAVLRRANEQDPLLISLGGGARDLGIKILTTPRGSMLIAELFVDCRDAMGANAVNTMVEAVAPMIGRLTGGRPLLRIISNLATRRVARARAVFDKGAIGGEVVVEGILDAYHFAASDPYRCATHNKGVMNGITALTLATGNDTRAIEAGAHAYAARNGRYLPLTRWEEGEGGDLVGTIEVPAALGIVGGSTSANPLAKIVLKILGVRSARELGEVAAAVGLAQNFAALRALATEGIQRGHMELHARNVAMAAGARGGLVDVVAERLVREKAIRLDRAQQILREVAP